MTLLDNGGMDVLPARRSTLLLGRFNAAWLAVAVYSFAVQFIRQRVDVGERDASDARLV